MDSCRQPQTCPRAHLPFPPVLSAQAGTIVMPVAAHDDQHMTARHASPLENLQSIRLLVCTVRLGQLSGPVMLSYVFFSHLPFSLFFLLSLLTQKIIIIIITTTLNSSDLKTVTQTSLPCRTATHNIFFLFSHYVTLLSPGSHTVPPPPTTFSPLPPTRHAPFHLHP